MAEQSRILAVLGPTNTGKTHYAIERMLGYPTGVIGLPLRLLAREVYDKIVAIRGPSVVALVTGEERIVPKRTKYWVCTVEAMPEGMGADFVAVDEIQLCADPERGHVFTDRLLKMRGLRETQFLGAQTMRKTIAALVPRVEFLHRERMSQLTYSGPKKIGKMPARSAIVGFSVDNVYAMAELLRRQKGGAAVVMGALSPRTRNAQVDLYQNGDVDYLVATDAIGMGLNLDINHVAFSSLAKFDGRRMRALAPNELGQIAGRAGRGMSHGTFGVTGEAPDLHEEVARAIMDHQFTPIRKLEWRNSDLSFGTVAALIASLEVKPQDDLLARGREADDLSALKTLAQQAEIRARACDGPSVRLLWDVCRVPDFRGISQAEHAGLLGVIYADLQEKGRISDDWLARQVRRIDRTDGDIDTLSTRLAYIRTWTYVAQRKGWVEDENHWRDATRAVEDRLSDALHERLTQRFVDRRTSVLLRRLKQKEAMVAEVNDSGEVTVEGEFVGRLEGFRFIQDKGAAGQEAKTLAQASLQALAPHFHLKADRFYNAPDTEIDFTEQGGLMWGTDAVGKLVAGPDPLKPQAVAFVDDEAGADVAQKVQRRLQHFIDRKVTTLFEPLLNIQRDETLSGLARGFGFRMVESFGVIPRGDVADEVKALDQDARGALRKHGIRFGQFTIFMPLLLKPAPTRLRLVLWSLSNGLEEFPEAPPPGLVTVPAATPGSDVTGFHTMSGYRAAGERAIRIDMLERLADMLRVEDSRGGFEAKADMLSITGMTLEQFADLMQGLGYRAERGEREKVKAVDVAMAEPAAQDAAAPAPVDVVAEEIADDGVAPIAAEPTDAAEIPAEIPSESEGELAPGTAPDAAEPTEVAEAAEATETADAAPEVEVFYTFSWAPKPRGNRPQHDRKPRGKGQPGKGKPGKGKPRGGQDNKAKSYSAKPQKKDRIDPDNPFAAALMGLKDKT
ncbi:helicase-related protein [uncultured Roseovarius sp.]|uniref:helicase-related protein n=1 Tax=uncultured Roseovarius sp. TaxID=293344 RepID=UPI0026299AB8|nr:helicase-related protein [uncultured Roseovarius sp.]